MQKNYFQQHITDSNFFRFQRTLLFTYIQIEWKYQCGLEYFTILQQQTKMACNLPIKVSPI